MVNQINVISSPSGELAVDVKNVVFEYKTNVTILDDLTLKIPKGKIFALLGPNGTGKTTLIRSILGRLQLKSGIIKVFGVQPGSQYSDIPGMGVGYMPQELALFEELTIEEILLYYGKTYHFKSSELTKRIDDLIEILNLPEKGRPINRLSGGQQRRVSIAITMIHRPKLIILDEPTVGVDSLLRHRIWQYLENVCIENNQTVLITTHYIEEAKNASNVAFMSYGTILKQSEPQKLLQEYNCQTLESVFLVLCQQKKFKRKSIKVSEILRETSDKNLTNNEVIDDSSKESHKNQLSYQKIDRKRIQAMLWKNNILSLRKPMYLMIYYLLPFVALTSIKLAFGQYPKQIPMAVFNADLNPQYSDLIIDSIDREYIDLKIYDSNETAFESVVNGINYMSVVFGQNFSDTFQYRVNDVFEITDEELETSKIKVYVDFSNPAMGIFVLKYLLRGFNTFLDLMSSEFGDNAERYFHTIMVEQPIYGEFEFNLAEVFGPGITILLCNIIPLAISALLIIYDRKNSSLERVVVSGVRPIEILIAHSIQNCILIAMQILLTLFISFVVYQNKQLGSYFTVYFLLYLTSVQGMLTGIFLALISKDEIQVAIIATFIMFTLWIISGIFWPIEAIPTSLAFLAKFGPLTMPTEALRAIMMRGWTFSYSVVIYGYFVNFIYVILISIVNIILFNKLNQ